MTRNFLCSVLLIVALTVGLAAPARAETFETLGHQVIAGIVVVSVAIAVTVTLLILHHKHREVSITGCVSSGPNGMSLTDEKDKRNYTLTGATAGVKAGDRMALAGHKRNGNGQAFVFETLRVTGDFGACQRYGTSVRLAL